MNVLQVDFYTYWISINVLQDSNHGLGLILSYMLFFTCSIDTEDEFELFFHTYDRPMYSNNFPCLTQFGQSMDLGGFCIHIFNSEVDSDHRIVSIRLAASLRTSKGKPCKRPKFNWKKLQDLDTKEEFQLELTNRFQVLSMDDATPISDRYETFETAVREVAEEVIGKQKPCGLPSWVSDATIRLKLERDEAKKRYSISKSRQSRERWRNLNTSLNNSYKSSVATHSGVE